MGVWEWTEARSPRPQPHFLRFDLRGSLFSHICLDSVMLKMASAMSHFSPGPPVPQRMELDGLRLVSGPLNAYGWRPSLEGGGLMVVSASVQPEGPS